MSYFRRFTNYEKKSIKQQQQQEQQHYKAIYEAAIFFRFISLIWKSLYFVF